MRILQFPALQVFGDGRNSHDEIVKVKWVAVHHYPARITHNLKNEATDHANHEPPSLVLDSQAELRNQKQTESSSIDSIASKRR